MKPDYQNAAIKAMELLRDNDITETPIDSFLILSNYPGVRVLSFTRMAAIAEMERENFVPLFGSNMDASTFQLSMPDINDVHYVVLYNMRLPYEIIWRAIARELGHIVLGHDGQTRPADVRRAEAMCFAHHLLSPRPVLNLLRQAFPVTLNVLSDTTGCSSECVEDIKRLPGVSVPKELNRQVRDKFANRIHEYIRFHLSSIDKDLSPVVDFGHYMDNYEE